MSKGTKPETILSILGIRDISDHAAILQKLDGVLDVDTSDSGGRTLLMEAVIRGDRHLVEILVNKGASVNLRDVRGWTALHFAAQAYDPDIVKLLLDAGADANAQDDWGNGTLFTAVYNSRGRGEVIKLLLANGADQNRANKSGISAHSLAGSISNYDIAQFFE